MTPRWYVPRRTLLRGMGTAVALPFLEAMVLPKRARAAGPDPLSNPRRFVGIWALPCGQAQKWDARQKSMVAPWTPDDEGPLVRPDADGFLTPFFGQGTGMGGALQGTQFRDVSQKLSVLTGLSDASNGHQYIAAMLGPHKLACSNDGCGHDEVDVGGPTADQIAANHFAQNRYTPIHSLAVGAQVIDGTETIATYSNYMSWRTATEHAPKDVDPAVVFDKLFGGDVNPVEDKAAADLRRRNRTSILDLVKDHAASMRGRLGVTDKKKLDQYFQGIVDIEAQIARAGSFSGCTQLPAAPMHANAYDLGVFDRRVKLLMDLTVKAFECDRTRVATIQFHNHNGSLYGWPFIGLEGAHHDMSHYTTAGDGVTGDRASADETNRKRTYMNTYGKWALQTLAYFMGELDKRMDVSDDGTTVLDNSVIFMSGDCGDGATHSFSSMNALLGGRGGRLASGEWAVRAGRHVRCSTPWASCWGNGDGGYCPEPDYYHSGEAIRFKGERSTKDLLWGMLRAVGVPDAVATGGKPTFGYATAPLDLTFPGKP